MGCRRREDYRMNGKHLPTLEARLPHLEAAFAPIKLARHIPAVKAEVRLSGERRTITNMLGDVDAEFQELSVDARGAPQRPPTRKRSDHPRPQPAPAWLDTWSGIGLVVAGIARQDYDLQRKELS